MKVGFGSKPKGKKKGGKGKKGKKDGADAMMADAAPEAMDDAPSNGAPLTAKEKQRRRMALKKQLKVKVAGLKAHRNKLTKLAGNKKERRELNKEMRGLVQEQLGLGGGKKGGSGSGGGEPAAAGMAE